MSFERIFPAKLYEGIGGEVTKLLSAPVVVAGATNNQQVIAAVTGKIIRVMGLIGWNDGAGVGRPVFKNGSGGTNLCYGIHVAPNTVQNEMPLPIVDSGYFETTAGTGLFCDVPTANSIALNIFYIVYTPD